MWQTKKLGDVAVISNGNSINENTKKEKYLGLQHGIPYIATKDIDFEGKVEYNNGVKIPINDTSFKKASTDTVLVCAEGGSAGKKLAYIDRTVCFVNKLFAVKSSTDLLGKFLYYWFLSDNFKIQFYANKTGLIGGVSLKKFKDLSTSFPSLDKQHEIVNKLDKVFKNINDAKENTKKNLQNSKELFESYIKDIFSKLNCEFKKLPEISKNLDSKRIPVTKKYRVDGVYPYYGASGEVDRVNKYIFDENLLLVSEDGANLLARTYPIAFSIKGKTWVNNHAHILKFEKIENQKFVEYYLNSIKLSSYVSGMAQPKLNQKMLNSIPIPFPKISVQIAIVKKLDELSTQTKKLEENYRRKLILFDELKKSVLRKAFSGEL